MTNNDYPIIVENYGEVKAHNLPYHFWTHPDHPQYRDYLKTLDEEGLIVATESVLREKRAGRVKQKWLDLYRMFEPHLRGLSNTRAIELLGSLFLEQTHPSPSSNPDMDSYTGLSHDEVDESRDSPDTRRVTRKFITDKLFDPNTYVDYLKKILGYTDEETDQWVRAQTFSGKEEEIIRHENGRERVPMWREALQDLTPKNLGELLEYMSEETQALFDFRDRFFNWAGETKPRMKWFKLYQKYIQRSRERQEFLDALQKAHIDYGFDPEDIAVVFMSHSSDWDGIVETYQYDWRLNEKDALEIELKGVPGYTNLYHYIEDNGDDILENVGESPLFYDMMTDGDIERVCDHFQEEIINTYLDEGPVPHTKSYIRGVFEALFAGRADLDVAGWDRWRADRSPTGQIAYKETLKKGGDLKKAMTSFVKAGYKAGELRDCLVGLDNQGGKLIRWDGDRQIVHWGLLRHKMKLKEVYVPKELDEETKLKWAKMMRGHGIEDLSVLRE